MEPNFAPPNSAISTATGDHFVGGSGIVSESPLPPLTVQAAMLDVRQDAISETPTGVVKLERNELHYEVALVLGRLDWHDFAEGAVLDFENATRRDESRRAVLKGPPSGGPGDLRALAPS